VEWSGLFQSATTIIADDYVKGVMDLMDEGIERFTIEHVGYSSSNHTLQVWIYNYGDNDIIVDVYVNVIGGAFGSKMENNVSSKAIIKVPISITIASGSEVAIKAASRRGNNAYYTSHALGTGEASPPYLVSSSSLGYSSPRLSPCISS